MQRKYLGAGPVSTGFQCLQNLFVKMLRLDSAAPFTDHHAGCSGETKGSRPIATYMFPKWFNRIRWVVLGVVLLAPAYAAGIVTFGFSTEATDVGYAPVQPIPFSHKLHAGELGMDCRYCHSTVEQAAHAAIPPTQTCINCHSTQHGIGQTSPKLALLRQAYYETGLPIPWVRVHDLPDYAYFDHSAHVNRGVGCVECHGRVDRMEVVYQAKPLSMSWCLDCHRNPGPRLRDLDEVAATDMEWRPPSGAAGQELARRLIDKYNIRDLEYMQNCSVCHR